MKPLVVCLALVLTSACSSDDDGEFYTVNYTQSSRSQSVEDNKALNDCAALDGAEREGTRDDYLAGGATLRFRGSAKERERFEDCLRGLRATVVLGPFGSGQTPSPLAR